MMNIRLAVRRFASLAMAIALCVLSANASFAHPVDPDSDPAAIIVIGG